MSFTTKYHLQGRQTHYRQRLLIDYGPVWSQNMPLAFLEKGRTAIAPSLPLHRHAHISHSWMITLTSYLSPSSHLWLKGRKLTSFLSVGQMKVVLENHLTEVEVDEASWEKVDKWWKSQSQHLTKCLQETHLTLDKLIIKQCESILRSAECMPSSKFFLGVFRGVVWSQLALVDQHFGAIQLRF